MVNIGDEIKINDDEGLVVEIYRDIDDRYKIFYKIKTNEIKFFKEGDEDFKVIE